MADGRRVGHAQRRRIGAPSNVYDSTIEPPTHGVGSQVRVKGRYGVNTVDDIQVGVGRAGTMNPVTGAPDDGHAYRIVGGKGGRATWHPSSEIKPVEQPNDSRWL